MTINGKHTITEKNGFVLVDGIPHYIDFKKIERSDMMVILENIMKSNSMVYPAGSLSWFPEYLETGDISKENPISATKSESRSELFSKDYPIKYFILISAALLLYLVFMREHLFHQDARSNIPGYVVILIGLIIWGILTGGLTGLLLAFTTGTTQSDVYIYAAPVICALAAGFIAIRYRKAIIERRIAYYSTGLMVSILPVASHLLIQGLLSAFEGFGRWGH